MLKPGQIVKTVWGINLQEIKIAELVDGEPRYTLTRGDPELHLQWTHLDFEQIAPEGLTLEEAKLYFAL